MDNSVPDTMSVGLWTGWNDLQGGNFWVDGYGGGFLNGDEVRGLWMKAMGSHPGLNHCWEPADTLSQWDPQGWLGEKEVASLSGEGVCCCHSLRLAL